jgi:hypothetical protein
MAGPLHDSLPIRPKTPEALCRGEEKGRESFHVPRWLLLIYAMLIIHEVA